VNKFEQLCGHGDLKAGTFHGAEKPKIKPRKGASQIFVFKNKKRKLCSDFWFFLRGIAAVPSACP